MCSALASGWGGVKWENVQFCFVWVAAVRSKHKWFGCYIPLPRWQCRGHSSYALDFTAAYMGGAIAQQKICLITHQLVYRCHYHLENVKIPKRNWFWRIGIPKERPNSCGCRHSQSSLGRRDLPTFCLTLPSHPDCSSSHLLARPTCT